MVLAAVYVAAAKLGIALSVAHGVVTPVWAPTGISLAALLIFGYRLWPAVALGAFVANVTSDVSWIVAGSIATGNTLEALAGTCLLRKIGFHNSLGRMRDVLGLVAFGAMVSTTVSATNGVTTLWLAGLIPTGNYPSEWILWWFGDAMGDLLVAPFLLVWAARRSQKLRPGRLLEGVVLLALLPTVSWIVFVGGNWRYPYLLFPLLIWAPLRFAQRGSVTATFIVAATAIWGTLNGSVPIGGASLTERVQILQALFGIVAITLLVLAAMLEERTRAEADLYAAHERLRAGFDNSPIGFAILALDGRVREVNPALCQMVGYSQSELVGSEFRRLMHPGDVADDTQAMPRLLSAELSAYQCEKRVLHAGGAVVWISLSLTLLHDERGEPVLFFAQIQDITERTRVYEYEHEVAEILQRSLLPDRLPDILGIELEARYLPGSVGVEIGGDWYDVIPLPGGQVGVVIGDVAGKGVTAASVMGQIRNSLRAYALEGLPPTSVLERLDRLVQHFEPGEIATVVYAIFDPTVGMLRFTSAGHLPPLILTQEGTMKYLEAGRGVPLGTRSGGRRREGLDTLEPGSTLLCYTDGLVERRGAPLAEGLACLTRAVAGGAADPESLCDRVLEAFFPREGPADDVALLALRSVPLPRERLELTLPAEPQALAPLRRALAGWLETMKAPAEEVYAMTLACCEVSANAIEHAYGPGDATFEVEAALDNGEVAITVRDFGRWRVPRGRNRGRGLQLMEAFMDRVEVTPMPQGTEVRLRRRLGGVRA